MAPVNKVEPFVFEVIDKARKQRHKDTKIEVLRKFEHWAVKDVLAGIYDDKIEFNFTAWNTSLYRIPGAQRSYKS